jgi:ammonia channel protein AmtB
MAVISVIWFFVGFSLSFGDYINGIIGNPTTFFKNVTIPQSFVIGIVASIISGLMVEWRSKTSIDDTLDVFSCQGIGGIVGMLFTGFRQS